MCEVHRLECKTEIAFCFITTKKVCVFITEIRFADLIFSKSQPEIR